MRSKKGLVRGRLIAFAIVGASAAGTIMGVVPGLAGAVIQPALNITPGPYHDGQLITMSVGPNHYFKPYARINIIECGDPAGKASNLPVNETVCDGNTIQNNTVLVRPDGSFSEHGYQVYALPNAKTLGELPDTRPVCSQKKVCVLYIGQNQARFAAPKVFSPPFTVSKVSRH